MLSEEKVLEIFKETDALLEGHFELSSGLHSPRYIQCARVLQYPDYASILCQELSKKLAHLKVNAVVGPALGAVVVAHEMARALKTRAFFTERKDDTMTLRRGFELGQGEKVLVVEDVVTTGGSTQEVIDLVQAMGAQVVSVAALVDRSRGKARFSVPMQSLIQIEAFTYPKEKCPLCEKKVPMDKPGSRKK